MEYRDDLENLLMDGLPESERREVADAIDRTAAEQLQHLRERRDDPADATRSDEV
jgi:hypothetical protein